MKKLVSILVNCHNGEKYLNEAIDSILKQSYQNFEIIFFDNASTDKSLNIIKNYQDIRINIYQSKDFLTLYEARNKALDYCKGDFISFLDVDDFWHVDFLKKEKIFLIKKIKCSHIQIGTFYSKKKKIN